MAGLGFFYTLVITLVLVFATGFFGNEESPRTILAWLLVPIVSTFLGWMCVRQAQPFLRIFVWLFVLATLFFCWIAIFSIGLFYLPAPILLILAALGPWDGDTTGDESPPPGVIRADDVTQAGDVFRPND